MSKESKKFIIAGAGGIGKAVGLILADRPIVEADIFIGDRDKELARTVAEWIQDGSSSVCSIESFEIHSSQLTNEMDYIFKAGDIILDCLPGNEAPRMASFALKYNMHYVNLTEYVKETEDIIAMVQNADTGFVLQSGLAPGYINILAHKLYNDFISKHSEIIVDHIKMRVGALSKNVSSPTYYAFTWSPIGVATEYVKDANIVRNSELTKVPALSETENRIIHGVSYEEDFTSGGAADLPDFFKNKTNNLDYKTLRYPGHYSWVRKQLDKLNSEGDRIKGLLDEMTKITPHLEEDLIVLYASVSGHNNRGELKQIEHSEVIEPMKIGSHQLKAIQLTTAVPMLEAARMLLKGTHKGAVLQSQIDPERFLSGPFINMVFNRQKKESSIPEENKSFI
ncbi:MAG: saccharopine dehydrogenase NADP-binding domain-containing protein [Saprospiraceae bacterium]|nr:saccharopine dehydrogenase NADP-binding domain-containing protein [Saprospiraceae bacterium]